MDCNEVGRLLDTYVDSEIELARQLDMEAHLAGCTACTKAAEAATKFRYSIHMNMPVYKTSPQLKAIVRAVLRKVSKSETGWILSYASSYSTRQLSQWCAYCALRLGCDFSGQRESADRSGNLESFTLAPRRSPARRHSLGSTCRKVLVHWQARLFSTGSGSIRARL
jgi:anti-sigma factor RsiW